MLPRYHIILGALFTLVLFIAAPETPKIYLTLVFLSSFLIDLDHYFYAVKENRSISLRRAFRFYKIYEKEENERKRRGIRIRGPFQLFHTIEFHALIAVIGIFWIPVFYIFIGMVFHSLLDLLSLLYRDALYIREFFFFNWLRKKIL